MASAALSFANDRNANRLVAGIPAAVRAAYALTKKGDASQISTMAIAVPGGWEPSPLCHEEWSRLVITPRLLAVDSGDQDACAGLSFRDGATVLTEYYTEAGFTSEHVRSSPSAELGELDQRARLAELSKFILKSTGKGADGLVSRYLNRPVSRFISGWLLRIPRVRPIHGTLLTAITALAMAASLIWGGQDGLVLGAILFHAASVIDGVDGEIARATMSSSEFGAKLDTVTDGITNIAFLCLTSLNLWWQDERMAAVFGAIGLALLTIGLAALGLRSIAQGGAFTFDAVKNEFRAKPSRIGRALAAVTSRDFYAAAFAVCAILNTVPWALLVFAVAAGIWLATIIVVLLSTRSQRA